MKKYLYIILLTITSLIGFSQEKYNFRLPLDKIVMVSTFGELRPNHFHSGLDFSGFHHIGMPVYAVADGYISRIRISADGYGNALYITHENGLKSVYGHLDHFVPKIQQYVENKQYQLQQFEITLYPLPDEIPVKKGQIIGYVGNTGRSYAPHLHFEMRNSYLDYPLNPLRFFPQLQDHTPPQIIRYAVYPATDTSLINGRKRKIILASGQRPPITTYGGIYFGVETYDFTDRSSSRKAPYIVQLFIDDSLWIEYRFDKIFFQNTRYVNTLMDYSEYIRRKIKIQRSYISPNNKLCIYTHKPRNVVYNPSPGKHKITYIVKDFYGNSSKLSFFIKASNETSVPITPSNDIVVSWNKDFHIDTTDFSLTIPAYSLYDTIHFHFAVKENHFSDYSPLYQIQNVYTPLNQPILLKIRPKTDTLFDKLVIVRINEKGKLQGLNTSHQAKWLLTRSKNFGNFLVMIDTIPPQVKLLSKSTLSKEGKIIFKISDNLSGIKNYDVYVNGKWTLFRYDAKTSRLWSYATERTFQQGLNTIEIYLTDKVNNIKHKIFKITVL